MLSSPRHLGEILLLIVLVAHVDLLEHSSSPSERNIKCPKTETRRWREGYLVTLIDRCSFLCVSAQRGTIANSMHEEHLCVVALTSMERGTQFFPLASYLLV